MPPDGNSIPSSPPCEFLLLIRRGLIAEGGGRPAAQSTKVCKTTSSDRAPPCPEDDGTAGRRAHPASADQGRTGWQLSPANRLACSSSATRLAEAFGHFDGGRSRSGCALWPPTCAHGVWGPPDRSNEPPEGPFSSRRTALVRVGGQLRACT